jgi:predicted molibdopterin-dependent oxidoreductase YjgC
MVKKQNKTTTTTRIPIRRGQQVDLTIDGQSVQAYAGETVAAVLLASGKLIFRRTEQNHAPRSLFCGMGICFDCLVTIDGVPNIRACLTPVAEDMVVETGGEPGD